MGEDNWKEGERPKVMHVEGFGELSEGRVEFRHRVSLRLISQ